MVVMRVMIQWERCLNEKKFISEITEKKFEISKSREIELRKVTKMKNSSGTTKQNEAFTKEVHSVQQFRNSKWLTKSANKLNCTKRKAAATTTTSRSSSSFQRG